MICSVLLDETLGPCAARSDPVGASCRKCLDTPCSAFGIRLRNGVGRRSHDTDGPNALLTSLVQSVCLGTTFTTVEPPEARFSGRIEHTSSQPTHGDRSRSQTDTSLIPTKSATMNPQRVASESYDTKISNVDVHVYINLYNPKRNTEPRASSSDHNS